MLTNVSITAPNIGIDIAIIITLAPNSTFEAIAASPESLHIFVANSERYAIPVIFNKIPKKL